MVSTYNVFRWNFGIFSGDILADIIVRPEWVNSLTLGDDTVETLYSTIYYSKYFIELNFDKSTQYVALWTHKRHPIPRPFGRAMECLLWVFHWNWPCYKGFLLYYTGFELGCCDLKSHVCETCKFRHNWPKKQHKLGLDMSNFSSPLYSFPGHFLLGDLVKANPALISSNFQTPMKSRYLEHFLQYFPQVNATSDDKSIWYF